MKSYKLWLPTCVIIMLWSCAGNPYRQANRTYRQQVKEFAKQIRQQPHSIPGIPSPNNWVGTTNLNLRKPNLVVIHHTAQASCQQTINTFTKMSTQVSAHYVICKDGTVHHMLNDYLRAWHAGAGKWGNVTDVNSSSIGIELDNNGYETFPQAQINSLLVLLDTLKQKYNLPAPNFIGHADVAPARKVDPNIHFPWQTLAARGFGLWVPDQLPGSDSLPAAFNHIHALKIIGYDVSDTTAAFRAFKRRFMAVDTMPVQFTEMDKRKAYYLLQQILK